MKSFLIGLTLLYATWVHAQNDYRFSAEIDSIVFFDTLPYRFQTASDLFSMIGEYKKAIEVRDQQFPNARVMTPTDDQKTVVKRYHPVSAKQVILQRAAKSRMIIFNEAHHQPRHRMFVASLLPELRKLGFAFIGFEALDYKDSLLNQRKYPLTTSGYYIQEPCFGNLIRAALANDYHVFPYEYRPEQYGMNRDYAEALNVKSYMDAHPDAKIILYCGYDHLIKDSTRNIMVLPMAGQVRRMTGIDPLTIDQTELSEYNIVGNSYRKCIDLDSDAVLLDSTGQCFRIARSPHKKVDLMVYHPNTVNYNYRPKWLMSPDKSLVNITPQIIIGFPCQVRVYAVEETDPNAVPTDVIELASPGDNKHIVLRTNAKNRILIVNRKGEKQELIR